jgi:hypothetical protein
MRLLLFRSLIRKGFELNRQHVAKVACQNSLFQGVELSSSQVTGNLLDTCTSHNVRVIVNMYPVDVDDVGRIIDQLSTQLSKSSNNKEAIDLVVIHQPQSSNDDDVMSYLYQVLPLAAQFLEEYPSIGRAKGDRNAHGSPLDTHVLGACHRLNAPTLDNLSEIVDILPPTRLSLNCSNAELLCKNISSKDLSGMHMEALVQAVDHFEFSNLVDSNIRGREAEISTFYEHVWKWQQEVENQETYASCYDSETAQKLHSKFHDGNTLSLEIGQ